MIEVNDTFAYLLGLITGRGHIFVGNKTVAIEFSHANEFANGIIHCQKCGDLVTKPIGEDKLICKKCGTIAKPNERTTYNQPKLTVESLKETIIPFLKSSIKANYDIIGNKSMTLLVIELKENQEIFEVIKDIFKGANSFDTFHIPKIISSTAESAKIEFVNGLLDTAGFASAGGWLNRQGEKLQGRMRVYFQIVRNWHLPVEIDNFLRKEFSLPIHTIDWGHPNIRDSKMEDYFTQRPTSWSREHQIKFFPEYYSQFKFRIKSKQALFEELTEHNKRAVFKNPDDWFPPTSIGPAKIKAYHPGESDLRIPQPARRHFNAFWQINAAMGCNYLKELSEKTKNPEYFLLTGKNEDGDIISLKERYDKQSQELKEKIFAGHADKPVGQKSTPSRNRTEALEKELYAPLSNHLKKYLNNKYQESVETFDTSAGNLNVFLSRNIELFEKFDFCEKFRIRPDIVGFLTVSKKLVFEEVKITPLDLKALGQLLGYCFVAQPEEAILISSKTPSLALIKILKARPDLLQYAPNKKVQIGTWQHNKFELLNI